MKIEGRNNYFVLSSGRVGTKYLQRLLGASLRDSVVLHDPAPTRVLFILSNIAMAAGMGHSTALSLYVTSHNLMRKLRVGDRDYVGIHYFTINFVSDLHHTVSPLRVVHLVRDPRSWITSMSNFKAAGWRRSVIDFLPFAQLKPPNAPDWSRLSLIEQNAWRWRYFNEQISACESVAYEYSRISYEDLFSADEEVRKAALVGILGALDQRERLCHVLDQWSDQRVNASRPRGVSPWWEWPDSTCRAVHAICGDLMRMYGYGTEEEWLRKLA